MTVSPLATELDRSAPFPVRLASALPDLAFAVACLATWIAPERLPSTLPRWIVLVMLTEFVVIHSSAFMGQQLFAPGSPGKRALAVLGLGGFYTLFVGAFAISFHSMWPLVSFGLLTLNRMSAVWTHSTPDGREREYLNATWGAHVMCYLLGAGLTTMLPLPRLGYTQEFVGSLGLPGSGLWIQQPWRVAAFGAIYFAGVGAFEWTNYRTLLPKQPPAPTN